MKNKAYYVSQGCLYAFGKTIEVDAAKLADINNQSWQAKAFRKGITEHCWRDVPRGTVKKCTHGITSHLEFLVKEWKKQNLEGKAGELRFYRIHRKIKNLCKKHGVDHISIINSVECK